MACPDVRDALLMIAASSDLDIFNESEENVAVLCGALATVEISTCEDFRFAFITDDEVDLTAIGTFTKSGLDRFQEVI